MARRKVVIETVQPICDQCQERLASRGLRVQNIEHLSLMGPNSMDPEGVYSLDFCDVTCKTNWLGEHESDIDRKTLEEQVQRRFASQAGDLQSVG